MQTFKRVLFDKLLSNTETMFHALNFESFGTRAYEPSQNPQDQPPAKCWEALVVDTCYEVSKQVYPTSKRYYGSVMSDDARELDDCIIFIDAKTQICYEREGRCESDGFQLRTKDTQSQFTATLQTEPTKLVKTRVRDGNLYKMVRQTGEISEVPGFYGKIPVSFNHKPIYCISASCSWYYENGLWCPYGICVCVIPSIVPPDWIVSRKSKDDVRVLIKDPSLYMYYEFVSDSIERGRIIKMMHPPKKPQMKTHVSESVLQIQDSVQLELTSDSETEQPDPSSQNQQMGP